MELGNALNWFEIPVADFDRAKKFYETIFNYQMPESMMGPSRMGFSYTILKPVKWVALSFITPGSIYPATKAH